MAMSLEELLAAEGFRGRRSKTMFRTSFASEAGSEPLYPFPDQHKSGSSSGVKRAERTKSDITRYNFRDESPRLDRFKGRSKDSLVKLDRRVKKETRENYERRGSKDSGDVTKSNNGSLKDYPINEIVEAELSYETVETMAQNIRRCDNIYLNEGYRQSQNRSKGKYSSGERRGRHQEASKNNIKVDKRYVDNSNKCSSLSSNYRISMKEPEICNNRSNRSSQNTKSLDSCWSQRQAKVEQTIVAEPALDEVAIQAVISILTGYIKRFLKEEDFRTSVRHSCYASLNFIGSDGINTDCNIIANLEQAIETVERAAEECASTSELKKASLQLSVITGLSSNDLKDGFTSGIANIKLSACAHLYLSVICKQQKKDRIAAKHLLQIFSNSPFQARTHLLPELWDYIFLPHLSHLKLWYNKEVESLKNTRSKEKKLKLLEKVCNETLDSGTYQLAVYYKDWLTEGIEAPSLPSIEIPSVHVWGVQQGSLQSHSPEIGSPSCPFSPYPMVSKKLYDAVFGHSYKSNVQVENYEEAEDYENSVRSSYVSAIEDKQALPYFSETVKHTDQDIESGSTSCPDDEVVVEDRMELHKTGDAGAVNIHVELENSCLAASECTTVVQALPNTNSNDCTLKTLAKSVFQQMDKSFDIAPGMLLPFPEEARCPVSLSIKTSSSIKEFHENHEDFDGFSLSHTPQEFICPLTGLVFKDPVTLETGQTFERTAITEWFGNGNRTCPITEKVLECESVPLTNFILKSIIDRWKSEHCRHLLAFVSHVVGSPGDHIKFKKETAVFLLEAFLSSFSIEERTDKVKQLVSLGGLQFLIDRFYCGNLEEKSCVVALLSYCIEADACCRINIARNVDVPRLLELLRSNHVKLRRSVVLLLIELICLNRRTNVNSVLSCFRNEGILNAKQALLIYLENCSHEQRPLVAVLLLHLDLLVNPPKYSIYREKAVDAITMALNGSISDEKVCEKCCKSLLILGGCFSLSGKIMTEDWILKQARFLDGPQLHYLNNEEENVVVDEGIPSDGDEEEARKEWLMNLSASLLADGKKSFLEAVSNCLHFGNLDLVGVCLVTLAWLSSALVSLSERELQLPAFSALVSQLKASMENGEQVEHKILATMSLCNFSKIPECKVLLMAIAEKMVVPLQSLAELTWTAKELYAIICGEDL